MDSSARASAAEGRGHEAAELQRIASYLRSGAPAPTRTLAELRARDAEIDVWLALPATRAMLARRMVAHG
jgi:hypothetical protein